MSSRRSFSTDIGREDSEVDDDDSLLTQNYDSRRNGGNMRTHDARFSSEYNFPSDYADSNRFRRASVLDTNEDDGSFRSSAMDRAIRDDYETRMATDRSVYGSQHDLRAPFYPKHMSYGPWVGSNTNVNATGQSNVVHFPGAYASTQFAQLQAGPGRGVIPIQFQPGRVESNPDQYSSFTGHHIPYNTQSRQYNSPVGPTLASPFTEQSSKPQITDVSGRDDTIEHYSSLVIRMARPIREPYDIDSYFKRLYRSHQVVERMLMDTFEGVVYVTFKEERDAQIAIRMQHNPEVSNILELWIPTKEEMEFSNDCISVHGDIVCQPDFQKHLIQIIRTKTGHTVLQTMQTDCPASMLIRLSDTHSLTDISRLLIAISMEIDVKVAPLKSCFMISIQWDQRNMAVDVVLDYIKWNNKGVEVKSVMPYNSGVILGFEDEKVIMKILSEASHEIYGRPLKIQLYHPCLSIETYQKNNLMHASHKVARTHPLTHGDYHQHRGVMYGGLPTAHQGCATEASPVPRNAMDTTEDLATKFNQFSPYSEKTGRGFVASPSYVTPYESKSQVFDPNSSNFKTETIEQILPRSEIDLANNKSNKQSFSSSRSSFADERHQAVFKSDSSENLVKQNQNPSISKESLVIDFKINELELLLKTKFIEQLQEDHSDLKLNFERDRGKIIVSGDPSMSKLTKYEILEYVANEFVSYDLSGFKVEELQISSMPGFAEQINEEFDKQNIAAYMSCADDRPAILYGKNEDKLKIKSMLLRFITFEEYNIDQKKIVVYQSKQWETFLQKLKSEDSALEFSIIKLDDSKPCILLVGSSHMQFTMKNKLREFEKNNVYKQREVLYDTTLQEYSDRFLSTDMKNIIQKTRELGAKIKQMDGAFKLEGLEDGLQYAEEHLTTLRDSIKTKRQTLDYPGCSEFLEGSAEEENLQNICKKYSCLIKLSEQGPMDEPPDEAPKEIFTIIAWDYIRNCKISVTKGDPEMLKVTRILNFIKASVSKYTDMPEGFVGGQEAWSKIKKDMIGSIGENLETTGEKNKDLKIHHFVCNKEEKHLKEALKLGFNKAFSMKCHSIAIALEGIDNLELKLEPSLRLIAETVTKQLNDRPNASLQDIFICGKNEKSLGIIASQLDLQSPHNNPTSNAQEKINKRLQKKTSPFSTLSPRSPFTTDTKSEIEFKPIKVKLVSGNILEETAEVLVTSIQEDLDMTNGQLIRAVLAEGGEEIQKELTQNYPDGINPGQFAMSSGGKLPFKKIYHACLPQSDTSGEEMKDLVIEILREAQLENLTSIAIPALGGGNPAIEPASTCNKVLSAIDEFAKENQQTSIKSVKLVIFIANDDVMKAYGTAFFNYSSSSLPQLQNLPPAVTPSLPYGKPIDSFGNIVVQLTSGDITSQKTNAIVVSVDKSLDLRKGKVAYAILSNGGESIQTELTQKFPNGLEYFEYGKTSSGKLLCKEIYFVCLPHWQNFDKKKMKKLILAILREIESSLGTTVSLPAFGTGNLGYPPDEAQKHTINCLRAFASLNPKYLRTVEIVIHPSDTIIKNAFLKGLHIPLIATSSQSSLKMIKAKKNESSGVFKKFISALTSAIGLNEEKSTETIFKVGTVTLSVKKGDITEETCDALVAAISDDMDLATAGAVCDQISKKCDKSFKKRCQQKASEIKLYGFTSVDVQAGSLKCKEVFFISINQFRNQWDRGIEKILQSAEMQGLKTLALPTFTAANPDTDISKLIQQIKGAIVKFGNKSPKFVTDIRLIVYDQDMLKAVSEQTHGTQYSGSIVLSGEDKELSENAHVVYYFTEESRVKCAMEEFMKLCSSKHKDFSCKSSSIKQFTDAHFKKIEKKCYKNMIKVTFNKDEGVISMAGFGDISKIQTMITDIEKEIQKQLIDNLAIDTPVHWQYESNDIFTDFTNVLNIQLEADFKGKKSHSLIDMDDETYIVDFQRLTITHKDTSSTMNIRRQDALEVGGEPIPKHWDHMSLDEQFKLVSLATTSDEYKEVSAYYRFHGAAGNILNIERVQNRALYQQFIAKKREIDFRNPINKNELSLFHGSDFIAVNDINQTGFNRSYCGKNATVYGHGVYFAQSSDYSEQYATPDANGLRKLYQARVLVGVSVETDSNTKYLPKQPGTDIPYDSGKAPDSRAEGIHIIFHDSQAYPEYIITFSLPVGHVAS